MDFEISSTLKKHKLFKYQRRNMQNDYNMKAGQAIVKSAH